MKKSIVSILVVCLVALSIVYVFSSIDSSSHETQSVDAVPSRPTTVAEEQHQNTKLSYPRLIPLGDPVDDPTPQTVS